MLEHVEHGVKHGQHDHVTLHQPATIRGCPLKIGERIKREMSKETLVFLNSTVCSALGLTAGSNTGTLAFKDLQKLLKGSISKIKPIENLFIKGNANIKFGN